MGVCIVFGAEIETMLQTGQLRGRIQFWTLFTRQAALAMHFDICLILLPLSQRAWITLLEVCCEWFTEWRWRVYYECISVVEDAAVTYGLCAHGRSKLLWLLLAALA